MTDPIIQSALARGKPVAARRVQALLDELERVQDKLKAAQVVAERARLWAAHDEVLAAALAEYREAHNA